MRFLSVFLMILALAVPASAQWEYGGKRIGYGPTGAIGLFPHLASDNSGGVYVVWTAYLEDRPGREIVLCHFDTSGTALFGGGLLITDDSLDQAEPVISPDGFGGCYVLWSDRRDFPDHQHGSLYAQRITYSGQMLWGAGVRMFYTPGYAPDDAPWDTDVYSDSGLGVIGVCKLDTGYQKSVLIAQRLDGNGNRLWDSLGVVIHADSGRNAGYLIQPHLMKSGNNMYCAWLDSALALQKFDQNGSIFYGQQGVSVSNQPAGNTYDNRAIQLIPDGYDGAIIGWLYTDIHLGYSIKADRISPSGQSLWQVNGKRLLPEERSQRWALGLHDMGGLPGLLAVVLGGYQASYQLMDLSGNLLLGPSGGVFTQGTFYASCEYDDTLYFMQVLDTLQNYYFGSKRDLAGNDLWPRPPYIHGWIDKYEIMPDRLGGMYVIFTLYRDFSTDWVYIQRIYPDGRFGGDTTGINDSRPDILPEFPFNPTNYPNPFNAQTTIAYTLPSAGNVTIDIFDITGRKVETLLSGYSQAGEHSMVWNAEGVSSGVYFYRIKAGEYQDTKRCLLLR